MRIIFGKRLKELRIGEGWSQSQLGEKVGIASNTISQYESGTRLPSIEVLFTL